MEAKKNTRYLLRIFLPLILIDAMVLTFIFYTIARDRVDVSIFSCAFFIVIFIGAMVFAIFNTNQRMRKALQSDSPQKLIELFSGESIFPRFLNRFLTQINIKIIPGRKQARYAYQALGYIYWGQYSQAREMLAKVDGENRLPMYQATAVQVNALLCYFEQGDFAEGIRLAEQYERLTQVGRAIPMHNWLAQQAHMLVEVGQVSSGSGDAAAFSSLEQRFSRSRNLLTKLYSAWALEKGYLQRGEPQKAAQMRAFINETAPYCEAFRDRKSEVRDQ